MHDTNIAAGVQKWSDGQYCVPCESDMRAQIRYKIESFIQDATLLEAVLDRLMTYDMSSILRITADPEYVLRVERKCHAERANNGQVDSSIGTSEYPDRGDVCSNAPIPDWSPASFDDAANDSASVGKAPRSKAKQKQAKEISKAGEAAEEQEHDQVKMLLRQLEQSQDAKRNAEEEHSRLKPELLKQSAQLMEDKRLLEKYEKKQFELINQQIDLEQAIKKMTELVREHQIKVFNEEAQYQANLAHEKDCINIIEKCSAKVAENTSAVNEIKQKHEGILGLISNDSKKEGGSDDNICALCLENPATCAFVPCGHRCICDNCNTGTLKDCIMCRAESQMIMRCY